MCLFGLLHERMNAGKPPAEVNWEPFWMGCFAGVVPWIIIFSTIGASADVGRVPGFVWGILGAYLFFFNTFPINMCAARSPRHALPVRRSHPPAPARARPTRRYLQYKQYGWWSDKAAGGFPGAGYLLGERAYQVQSLVSKSLLLWLVYGGTNQPTAGTA